jgi:hypothetical protein
MNLEILTKFGLRKVHLGMRIHEFFHHILFLLLLATRKPLGFPLLVYHHLFHGRARLPVKVSELTVLRPDLLCIDFRIPVDYTIPPAHRIELIKGNS